MYFQKLRTFCGADNQKLLFVKLATALPSLASFILQIFMRLYIFLHKLNDIFSFIHFPELPLLWLHDRIGEHVIRVRKERNEIGRVDLLHLMIDAATDQDIVVRKIKNTRCCIMLFKYLQKKTKHSLFILLGRRSGVY
jgi:hypothetical protein